MISQIPPAKAACQNRSPIVYRQGLPRNPRTRGVVNNHQMPVLHLKQDGTSFGGKHEIRELLPEFCHIQVDPAWPYGDVKLGQQSTQARCFDLFGSRHYCSLQACTQDRNLERDILPRTLLLPNDHVNGLLPYVEHTGPGDLWRRWNLDLGKQQLNVIE